MVARKQAQPGSAPASEKPIASVSPRKDTGSPRGLRRGPPVAKKPARGTFFGAKEPESPTKPASPQTSRKAFEDLPTDRPVSPRKQPMKPEVSEPEVQVVQQSPREAAGTSFVLLLLFCVFLYPVISLQGRFAPLLSTKM